MKVKKGLRNGAHSDKLSAKKRKRAEDDIEDEDIEVESAIPLSRGRSFEAREDAESSEQPKKKGSMKKHRDELQGLESADPEFFQYLKENDASLLDFGEDEDDDDDFDMTDDLDNIQDSDDEDHSSKNATSKRKSKKKTAEVVEVTEDLVQSLIERISSKEGSLTSFKKLLLIFRAACMPANNSLEEDNEVTVSGNYSIDSPELYEYVMTTVLDFAYLAFYRLLNIAHKEKITSNILENHNKWRSMQVLILSYFKSIIHILTSLVDNVSQGQVCVLIISSLENYIPLLAALPRLAKKLLKVLLSFWSKELLPSEDPFNMRGHAFLRIRQMTIKLPGIIPSESYRLVYLAFARSCKSFTETSFSNVLFMSQSIVELYLCDASLAYQQGFLHIRQLALLVRTAILKKTSDSIRQITNWQFLNCLRLWTRVICAMPSNEAMGALAFPLVQVMMGVLSMASSIYYLPLRFHMITCCHQLTASCHIYIPIAYKILEILDHTELTAKSTPSSEVAPNFTYLIKFTSDNIGHTVVRDGIIGQIITLIRHDVELYRFHVALPEYSYLISRKLRQFSKKCKIPKWRDMMRPLVTTIDQYVQHVKSARLSLGKPPSQITDFEPLLPKNGSVPDVIVRLQKLLSIGNNITALTRLTDPAVASAKRVSDSASSTSGQPATKKSKKEEESVDKSQPTKEDKKVKPKKVKKIKQAIETMDEGTADDAPDQVTSLDWIDEDD